MNTCIQAAPESHGFVRVAAGSHFVEVGNCHYNAERIIDMMRRADAKNAKVLVLNELGTTAYTCGDTFFTPDLRAGALRAIEKVRLASQRDFGGLLFIGAPIVYGNALYNCAVVIHRGSILGVVPKTYLPTNGEFDEARWFESGNGITDRSVLGKAQPLILNGVAVPFGTDLLFKATDMPAVVVGAEICEDGWATIPPHRLQALAGATVLVNLSASNELVGKSDYRRSLVTSHSAQAIAAYLYASAGDGESTTDVVYSDHCMIGENGSLLAECRPLSEEQPLIVSDIDVEHLVHDRMRTKSFRDCARFFSLMLDFRHIEFRMDPAPAPRKLARHVDPYPFVPSAVDSEAHHQRCSAVFAIQVRGLKKRFQHMARAHGAMTDWINHLMQTGQPLAVEGVSGGSDSTEVLLVACQVFDALGIPRSLLHGYSLPGFGTMKDVHENSHELMRQLGVTIKEVDIRARCLLAWQEEGFKPFGIDVSGMTVKDLVAALSLLPPGSKDVAFENKQARARTDVLMNAGFVIGTGDLSESAVGWCTYQADHMSMYNPNSGVPKTLVQHVIAWAALNQFHGQLQDVLIDIGQTVVSPHLLPPGPNGEVSQSTDDLIGPIDLRDFFLYHFLRRGCSPEKIVYLAGQAPFHTHHSEDEVRYWLALFIRRFFEQRYKHSCLPDGPKVGSVSLNPRYDCHYPSDVSPDLWLKQLKPPGAGSE